MTSPLLLLQADRVAVPWANGGGITYQVLASPADAGFHDFDWRISFADVEHEGPFSRLPGVDRVLVLTTGQGMTLVLDDGEHDVRPFEPVVFAGESAVVSRLPHGATADLNVMTRRGRAQAVVEVIAIHDGITLPAPSSVELIAVLEGSCALAAVPEQVLGSRDCLLLRGTTSLRGWATLARIRIEPV